MGNLCINNQTQYNSCDKCNNNNITFTGVELIPCRYCLQGSIYFRCKNNHCFYLNVSESYPYDEAIERINKRYAHLKKCTIYYKKN